MSSATGQRTTVVPDRAVAVAVRPVVLLTFDVPYDDAAVTFAFETAAETQADLLITDIVPAMRVPSTANIRSFGDPYVVETQIELSSGPPSRACASAGSCSRIRDRWAPRSTCCATRASGCSCSARTASATAGSGSAATRRSSAATRLPRLARRLSYCAPPSSR